MLEEGRFKDGWHLHGLQVPAEGAQRWQLTKKPKQSEVPFCVANHLPASDYDGRARCRFNDVATPILKLQREGHDHTFTRRSTLKIYDRSSDIDVISLDDLPKIVGKQKILIYKPSAQSAAEVYDFK